MSTELKRLIAMVNRHENRPQNGVDSLFIRQSNEPADPTTYQVGNRIAQGLTQYSRNMSHAETKAYLQGRLNAKTLPEKESK
jgi:hypothetical protein